MKKCPFCSEDIQDAARKCKHCQSNIPALIKDEVKTSGSFIIKGLKIISLVFYFIIVFSIWASAPFWGLLLIVIPIWLIPDSDKSSTWKIKLKNWKKHMFRTGISILMIFSSLILMTDTAIQQIDQNTVTRPLKPQIEIVTEDGHAGDDMFYTIVFNVTDAEEISVNNVAQSLNKSGSYSVEVELTKPFSTIRVDAVNGYSKAFDYISVERNAMTPEEVIEVEERRIRVEEREERARLLAEEQAQESELEIKTTAKYQIEETDFLKPYKASFDIRLESKISEDEIGTIAKTIKSENPGYDKYFLLYYLPDMEIGEMAWATSHYDPTLKINILGLTNEEELELKETSLPEGEIVGEWIDDSIRSGLAIIYIQDGQYKLKESFSDGGSIHEDLVKVGNVYTYDNDFGEYLKVESNGDLGWYGDNGKFLTLKKIK